MDPLLKHLIECEALLRQSGETAWVDMLAKFIKRARSRINPKLADDITSIYGGMGSFNDLAISRLNGDDVDPKDEDQINRKLDQLRKQIYAAAQKVR